MRGDLKDEHKVAREVMGSQSSPEEGHCIIQRWVAGRDVASLGHQLYFVAA